MGLSSRGEQVPLFVSAAKTFGPGEYVEFVGRARGLNGNRLRDRLEGGLRKSEGAGTLDEVSRFLDAQVLAGASDIGNMLTRGGGLARGRVGLVRRCLEAPGLDAHAGRQFDFGQAAAYSIIVVIATIIIATIALRVLSSLFQRQETV